MAKVLFDSSAPVGFLIVPDDWDGREESSALIQTDWDYAGVAMGMGWDHTGAHVRHNDSLSRMLAEAFAFIEAHEGESFPALDAYLPELEGVDHAEV